MHECRRTARSIQSRGDFMELGHFNHIIKNTNRELRLYKTTFWMEDLTQRWIKSEHYFWFSKKCRMGLPHYPWKCLDNVLTMSGLSICLVILHVWQAFEDASESKCVRVLNMAQFYMQGLNRVLNMSKYGQYASKMPEYLAIFLNVPQYAWKLLNIADCS